MRVLHCYTSTYSSSSSSTRMEHEPRWSSGGAKEEEEEEEEEEEALYMVLCSATVKMHGRSRPSCDRPHTIDKASTQRSQDGTRPKRNVRYRSGHCTKVVELRLRRAHEAQRKRGIDVGKRH